MSTLEKQEVLDEIDMIQRNYPDETEFLDVLSDYIIGVHEDAQCGLKRPEQVKTCVGTRDDLVMIVYDVIRNVQADDDDARNTTKTLVDALNEKFVFTSAE